MSATSAWAKEIAIRRRIASIYNKREEHFASLRDYNDYLEEVEDMTFNLIEGIGVDIIEAKIKKYQEENAEQIINSRAQKAEELAAALKASKMNSVQNDSSNTGVAVQGQYAPAAVPGGLVQPRPLGVPQPIPGGYRHGYVDGDEETMKLRAQAGGWTVELCKRRAFEEAFNSLWI